MVADRNLFWGRQFLDPYPFTVLEGDAALIKSHADEIRARLAA